MQLKDFYSLMLIEKFCHFLLFEVHLGDFLLLRLGSTIVLGSTYIDGQFISMVPTFRIINFDLILGLYLAFEGPLGLTTFLNIALFLLYYTVVTLREEGRLTSRILW